MATFDKQGPGGSCGAGPDETTCEEALRQVQEYLDGELETVSNEQLARHFDVCRRCYPHLNFEKAYREAMRRAAAGECAPPELRAKVSTLIAAAEPEA
jgi:anti-sigma factor (TIGR02949 family)